MRPSTPLLTTDDPDRLGGQDIPLLARVLSIADTFDAMTSKRAYQRAFTPFEALRIMREPLRDKFDQVLLEHFIRLLRVPR